jgi:hypothetical protein
VRRTTQVTVRFVIFLLLSVWIRVVVIG